MRIVIADVQALFRAGLKSLLRSRGHEVVGEAGDGHEVVRLAFEVDPDVVLLDAAIPVLDALTVTRRIRAARPKVAVIVVAASDRDVDPGQAAKAGAQGCLLKSLRANQFFEQVIRMAQSPAGEWRGVVSSPAGEGADHRSDDGEALTKREAQILTLLSEGVVSNRDLARRLGISENTVKFHVRRLFEKRDVHDRAQLVSLALGHALLSPRKKEVRSEKQ